MEQRSDYKNLVNIIVFSIPATVLADWLFEFEITNFQAGLYMKGASLGLFLYVLLTLKSSRFLFKTILLYFLGLFLIYSLFSDSVLINLYFSVRVAYWILGTLVFYSFFQYGLIKPEQLKKMLILTVIIAAAFTFLRVRQLEEGDYNTASAYLLLWCIPLLMMFRKDRRIQVVLAICVIAIIFTIKRGAIIAMLASFFAFYFASLTSSKTKNKGQLILPGLLIALFVVLAMYARWDIIENRLQDTGASGRDVMYEGIVNSYLNSDFENFVFGNGINSVQKFTAIYLSNDRHSIGVTAHSEWLQYAYDFGIFGILFMIFLHILQLRLLYFLYKEKSGFFPVFLMFYVIFSFTTIYSFILNTPKAILLGIGLAFFSFQMLQQGSKIKSHSRNNGASRRQKNNQTNVYE
ncbi:O-antigen ligase family protein [Sphingobacterium chuzhouense]|uniref:O-antigen ligase family protein n=1 Tax=Sphingobacterium chuzhouense TaxID=1742264 RepID=A0ABR7XXP6_9SPHI|nr:O-antigen ligase family protein [Sphingobacterium chuzhouense]MBD1423802.1 O-antigen ligase family protein [Sphingobacterium chuzhouense]